MRNHGMMSMHVFEYRAPVNSPSSTASVGTPRVSKLCFSKGSRAGGWENELLGSSSKQ